MNPSSPPIEIEGYVYRFELVNGQQTWTQKWAILCDFCLYLYDSRLQTCKFAVILPGARLSVVSVTDSAGFQRKALLIEERNGTFVQMATDSESEFQRWKENLAAAVVLQKIEKDPNPSFSPHLPEGFNLEDPPPGRTRPEYSPYYDPHQAPVTADASFPIHDPHMAHDPLAAAGGPPSDNGSRQALPYVFSEPDRLSHPSATNFDGPELGNSGAVSLGVSEPQIAAVGDEQLLAPQRAFAQESMPVNGQEHFGGDLRFQSQPELSTLERQMRAGQQMPKPPLPSPGPQFQSIPDLSTLDRHRRIRDFRRPSATQRGASLTDLVMETVKEDPAMPESDILATLPLSEIRKKYPVSGLAKRMSIAASDLLGKSHDELVLSLIQLHREKANLEAIREYCLNILDKMAKGEDTGEEEQIFPENEEEKKIRLQAEVDDVNQQLELSMPLITFIDNIVKMGSLFGGNDVMFATEYRKHLLVPDEYCPPTSNLTFLRGVQERSVASTLSRKRAPESLGGESSTYARLQDANPSVNESTAFVKSREQLETELSELENIVVHYHLKKAQITEFMHKLDAEPQQGLGTISEEGGKDMADGTLRRSLRRGISSSSEEAQETPENAHHPRRSCSRLLRSDMTMSLRNRQAKKNQYRTLPPNLVARLQRNTLLSRTLPSDFRTSGYTDDGQNVYDRAGSIGSDTGFPPPPPERDLMLSHEPARGRHASLPAGYLLGEEELSVAFGQQARLGESRVSPASDSRLNRAVPARAPGGGWEADAAPTALHTTPERADLLVVEHVYQNEPLPNAHSTPSLFRAELEERRTPAVDTDPHTTTWTTVYEQRPPFPIETDLREARPLPSLDPLAHSSGMTFQARADPPDMVMS